MDPLENFETPPKPELYRVTLELERDIVPYINSTIETILHFKSLVSSRKGISHVDCFLVEKRARELLNEMERAFIMKKPPQKEKTWEKEKRLLEKERSKLIATNWNLEAKLENREKMIEKLKNPNKQKEERFDEMGD